MKIPEPSAASRSELAAVNRTSPEKAGRRRSRRARTDASSLVKRIFSVVAALLFFGVSRRIKRIFDLFGISFLFVDYLSVRRPWETRSSSSDGMGWTARCSGVSGLTLAIYGPADRASHTNEAHRSPGDSRDGLGSPWEPRLFLVSETKKLKLAACRRR